MRDNQVSFPLLHSVPYSVCSWEESSLFLMHVSERQAGRQRNRFNLLILWVNHLHLHCSYYLCFLRGICQSTSDCVEAPFLKFPEQESGLILDRNGFSPLGSCTVHHDAVMQSVHWVVVLQKYCIFLILSYKISEMVNDQWSQPLWFVEGMLSNFLLMTEDNVLRSEFSKRLISQVNSSQSSWTLFP